MAKGRLNNVEKMAIQTMVSQGKTVEEMCDTLGRSKSCVENYINSELDDLVNTIAKVKINQEVLRPAIIKKTTKKFQQILHGKPQATAKKAKERVERVINQLSSTEISNLNNVQEDNAVDILYGLVFKTQNSGDLFIKETSEKGRSGIAVMTKAASEKGDEVRKKVRASRKTRDNVFRPKQNRMGNVDDQ